MEAIELSILGVQPPLSKDNVTKDKHWRALPLWKSLRIIGGLIGIITLIWALGALSIWGIILGLSILLALSPGS